MIWVHRALTIITPIFTRFEQEMERRLKMADGRKTTLKDNWVYLRAEFMWDFRFLYHDINDLVARNRILETNFKRIVEQKKRFALEVCRQFIEDGEMEATPDEIDAICTNMVEITTHWLSHQFCSTRASTTIPSRLAATCTQ